MKQFNDVSKVALLLLALALPALAAGPIIVENPIPPFLISAAAGCGTFDVQLAPEAGKPNGGEAFVVANSAIFAGPTFVTLTNISTGKSISLNISGPARVIISTNTTVVVNLGLTLAFGNSPNFPANLQGIALASGRLVTTFDNSTGNTISVSFSGRATNVCPLLE